MRPRLSLPTACVAMALLASTAMTKEFSDDLTPEEFSAAGLHKLSLEELNRLNALVGSRREAAVQRKAASPLAERDRTETQKGDDASFLHRMRVRLAPGTQIDYETVETKLAGPFRGYVPGDVLTLENGQRWKVIEGRYWSPASSASKPRKVSIEPGVLGSFYLEIEDGGRPKVRFVGGGN